MAAADPPAGLMDIASTLSQDDIPFKLRCAICNNLAVNAFRLPCCDQSVCETCQASLSDTCPVCAHSPVSPDLCKPNKALRTTLKAFLRTEEKKREKEHQAAAPATPTVSTPTASEQGPVEATIPQNNTEAAAADISEVAPPTDTKPGKVTTDAPPAEHAPNGTAVNGDSELVEAEAEPESTVDQVAETVDADNVPKFAGGDVSVNEQSATAPTQSQQSGLDPTRMDAGAFPGMSWNGPGNPNAMNPFMANAMFNFTNPMGMPMTMDPMAANPGMFGDYGMNMTGMGINMGMNYNGQGMYGSLGWDGSQQNMWHGGQDNFNPNAFANGTGPPYGGAFGGSNMSYPSNLGFQSGYYGPGYGRGGFRGRGRGGFQGPGRGGFGGPSANPAYANHHPPGEGPNGIAADGENIAQTGEHDGTKQASEATPADGAAKTALTAGVDDTQQLQGIPTIDNLGQPMQMNSNDYQGPMGPGFGRGGFMRGHGARGGYWNGPHQPHIEQSQGPGVEGAPAAPRAMRQGLPNTSVLRQRGGLHGHGKSASVSSNTLAPSQRADSETPQGQQGQKRPPSTTPSQPPKALSRSRSPSQSRIARDGSPAILADDDRNGHRINEERLEVDYETDIKHRRSRSPSRISSSRSSRHRHRERERDRRDHRSHRSRHHHGHQDSRSRSPATNGAARHHERLASITEDTDLNGHKAPSETSEPQDLTSRVSNRRASRDRHSRHDEERDRDRARGSRHRDKDRDRERGRRDRARDSERDRRRDRNQGHAQGRDREREQDRGKDRSDRDRKRSRRDRSTSTQTQEDSSRPQARRAKRETGNEARDRERAKAPITRPEPEKDAYTLEREARNRERMQREQQNRGETKSSHSRSHRRDARQERLVGGRRINYKYEDEL